MCGIWVYISKRKASNTISARQLEHFYKLAHRGPDDHRISCLIDQASDSNITMGFHRLAIIDPDPSSGQPLQNGDEYLVCNGEIYNYRELLSSYGIISTTKSDCEVIIHLYRLLGTQAAVVNLDAEFAFVLYDSKNSRIVAARDPYGVRPLFFATDGDGSAYFSSEVKGIPPECHGVPFLPNHYMTIDLKTWSISYRSYTVLPAPNSIQDSLSEITTNLHDLLTEAVRKRLMSDRPLGCLLSGGLDSSLVTSIVCKLRPDMVNTMNCYTIGMEGSVDVAAAKKVVEFLGIKNHHIVPFTVEQGIAAIDRVIYYLESYDVTTVRASTPQYCMSEWINKHTDNKVLLSGEGPDEVLPGYQYFKMATDPMVLHKESLRLLSELYLFDNLRTDRTMAAQGLEVRVPYLDKALVAYVNSIDPNYRMCNNQMEKMIMRKAFADGNYLPEEILYRHKEAFSDAVSAKNQKSWYQRLREYIDLQLTDADLLLAKTTYASFNPPETKEELYYRRIFEKHYPGRGDLIPHYWMPKWVKQNQRDPSATVLECHTGDLTGGHSVVALNPLTLEC